jgi:hypothetical protein
MRWVGHIAHELTEMHKGFWWENLKERDHTETLDTSGRIILIYIIKKQNGRCGLEYLGQHTDHWQALVNKIMQGIS